MWKNKFKIILIFNGSVILLNYNSRIVIDTSIWVICECV